MNVSDEEIQRVLEADAIVAKLPRPKCYVVMENDDYTNSVIQMMSDLRRLASEDGCIAAAWAVVQIEQLISEEA